jgi:hypothetical protein
VEKAAMVWERWTSLFNQGVVLDGDQLDKVAFGIEHECRRSHSPLSSDLNGLMKNSCVGKLAEDTLQLLGGIIKEKS